MEQEPVYVPSGQLVAVCERVLGAIYDLRQSKHEQYVRARVDQHNQAVLSRNHKRRWWIKLFKAQPEMMITPQGMELAIEGEVAAMSPELAVNHPLVQIHREYGRMEHEAKDAIIMAGLTDAVPISADFARGASHLGVDPNFMRKPPFGFHPIKIS